MYSQLRLLIRVNGFSTKTVAVAMPLIGKTLGFKAKLIDFLIKGCSCITKGCKSNACGCRKKSKLCGPGCEYQNNCVNLLVSVQQQSVRKVRVDEDESDVHLDTEDGSSSSA